MFSPGAVSNRAPARSGPPRKHLLAPLGPSSACSNAWIGRSFLGGLVDDLCDRLWLEDGRPSGVRRVIQPLGPVLQKTLFPAPHGLRTIPSCWAISFFVLPAVNPRMIFARCTARAATERLRAQRSSSSCCGSVNCIWAVAGTGFETATGLSHLSTIKCHIPEQMFSEILPRTGTGLRRRFSVRPIQARSPLLQRQSAWYRTSDAGH